MTNLQSPKKKTVRKDISLVLHALRLFHEVDHVTIPVMLSQCVLTVVRPYILIFLSCYLVNALYQRVAVKEIFFYVWFILIIHLVLGILEHYLGKVKWIKYRNIGSYQQLLMNKKILTMDYEYLESEEIGQIIRHQTDYVTTNRGVYYGLFYYLDLLLQKVLTVGCAIVIVIPLFFKRAAVTEGMAKWINSPWLTVMIVGNIALGVFWTIRSTHKLQQAEKDAQDEMLRLNRKFMYLSDQFLDGYDRGKDVRIFELSDLINVENKKMIQNIDKRAEKLEKARWHFERISQPIAAFNGGLVYLFVGLRALIGAITPGEIMKYAGSIIQFINAFSEMMACFSAVRVNNEYLEEFIKFMDLKSIKRKGQLPIEKRRDNRFLIEYRHVSFKYPGSEVYALRDINLRFEIGGKMAVVGRNGSGKTTFIKLLCRLYDPTEGEILLNGINIKKFDYASYLKLFSVVFQDSKIYSFSVGSNVAASEQFDHEKVEDVLLRAGLSDLRKRLPDGLDTYLYKDFDESGIEISGGEAQRMTIARAIYQDRPFVIMDEPTAALDPVAEYNVYVGFDQMVQNKTAIYISHRLSSCRFCDEILVFDKGSVCQQGNHESLVNTEGIYQTLWHAQAQYYANTDLAVVFN